MKRKELVEIAGVALVTAGVLLAALWPTALTAAGTKRAEIKWPSIQGKGYRLSLRAEKATYAAGETPVVEIECVGSTPGAKPVEVTVSMLSMSPMSRVSRVAVLPKPLWQHRCTVVASEGEPRTLRLDTGVKIPKGTSVYLTLTAGGKSVSTRPLSAGPGMLRPGARSTAGNRLAIAPRQRG